MSNIDELIIKADSSDLKESVRDYDKLGDAAERTEDKVDASARNMDQSVGKLSTGVVKKLGAIAAAYISVEGAIAALGQAKAFDAALAETSTLLSGAAGEMDMLESAAKSLAAEFGTNASSQVQAFYQALSAGADGVTGATELLTAANKLAVGGITDVTTGVNALTTAVNAYGPDVISAQQASDALFVAMKGGKTTIGELSASLGQIIPIAAAAGVSFDEAVGGIAALTTQGLTTASATTGLRQIIASIVAPTKEATDAAKELGLEFNTQALEAKGLEGFLNDLIQRTGGSTDEMAKLFGSVEALGAALAFAGGGGNAFADIMAEMGDKVGATDAAVEKINESLSKRLDTALAQVGLLVLEFGQALLTVAVPALEALVAVLTFVSENFDVLAVAMLALTATQIPAAIVGLASLVSSMTLAGTVATVTTGAITALKVAMSLLGGPIGIAIGLATAAAGAFLLMRDDADEAEAGLYDSRDATVALNSAMSEFSNTGAPAAGKAAIDLANDNVKLASSAYDAAEAELALARAALEAARAMSGRNSTGRGVGTSRSEAIVEGLAAEAEATAQLNAAEAALQSARDGRKAAAALITGSDFTGAVAPGSTPTTPTRPDGLGGSGGSGGSENAEMKAKNDLMAEGKALTESLWTEQEKYNAAVDQANRLLNVGAITTETYNMHLANLGDELVNAEWGHVIDSVESLTEGLVRAGLAGENLGEALVKMLLDMVTQWIAAAIAAKAADILSGGILSASMGAGGGGGGILGAIFGGARANGGPAKAGVPYLVNENTPNSEIFVPSQSGAVLNVGQAQQAMQSQAPAPNITVLPAPVNVINDPRAIDTYRMSPQGEAERQRADKRLQRA